LHNVTNSCALAATAASAPNVCSLSDVITHYTVNVSRK